MIDSLQHGHRENVTTAAQAMTIPIEDAATPQFAEIYNDYFSFVFRLTRRLGVAERSLEDATQDVFTVVHRRLSDFENRSSVKTWLYGITRRVAKDYRRRSSRKEQGIVPTDGLISDTKDPEQEAAQREAAQILQTLLESIEPGRREIFVLAEMEQMTVPEIAETLSINLNTTYSRLRVARSEFEKAVARHLAAMEKQS